MDEKKLYNKIKEKLVGSNIICERVENSCIPGMPDVYLRTQTQSFWIENKICNWNEQLVIRKSQLLWIMQHALKFHTNVFVLISDDNGDIFFMDMKRLSKNNYYSLLFSEKHFKLKDIAYLENKKRFFYGSYKNINKVIEKILSLL